MGFSMTVFFSILSLVSLLSVTSSAQSTFRCTSSDRCHALIDYASPNSTALSVIKDRFGVRNLRTILGANNLPLSTPPTYPVAATQIIKIPIPCLCRNGTGISDGRPNYRVVPDDGLYHIAADVFSNLVTYQQIQAVNNITDANLIEVGQELLIPLPCSCDEVDGNQVVHYGHVVANGSTVEGIAQEYNTTADTLLSLNGMNSSSELLAGAVLDVPLKACASNVNDSSLDYPLLVANGTYVFTATNCVRCQCNAATSWTLQCEPSGLNSSTWQSCPSMQCSGAESLYLGNSTSISNCNRTTCAYAGYNNQTVLTTLAQESTCPDTNGNSASKFGSRDWRWNFLLIVVLLCLHLLQ